MNIFTVSFFGHRQIENALDVERKLEAKISELIKTKQYEYYRDRLLTFGEDVKWKTLGDIGKVSMCKRIMKNETSSDGDVPF